MIKLAICKIHMIGSPALVLGIGRQHVEGDEFWTKYQLFTAEEYVGNVLKEDLFVPGYMEKMKKYHGDTVFFTNLNKTVPVLQCGHDFNFGDATQVEITLDELKLLHKDLNQDQWQEFDLETWGK